MILYNVRTPNEREGDLTAQIASCRIGERRLSEIVAKYGLAEVNEYARHLLEYSAEMMRASSAQFPPAHIAAKIFSITMASPKNPSASPPPIKNSRRETGPKWISPAAIPNARAASTPSRHRLLRRLLHFPLSLDDQVPATSGLMWPIKVVAPEGTIVNARPPAAVAGGNVETSQRIVDTLLRALAQAIPDRIPAASQGTMNNLTFGGTRPPLRQAQLSPTTKPSLAVMGARPGLDGISGIHTHMTNSLNTPVEVLEHAYPVRVRRYSFRPDSGGAGLFRGGDGLIREVEFLTDAHVGLLCDRRARAHTVLQVAKRETRSQRTNRKWKEAQGRR